MSVWLPSPRRSWRPPCPAPSAVTRAHRPRPRTRRPIAAPHAVPGRPGDGLRREGQEHPGRPAADRRRGQRSEADPTQLATLIDGGCSCPSTPTKMMRFFELAFQQTQITAADFADQSYPRPDRHQRDDRPAAGAERAGELRAHDARSSSRRASRSRRRDDDEAADDDDRAEGALRVPRHLGGRRQQQRSPTTSGRRTRAEHHGRGCRGPHPHRRDAGPDEPQLHALVRPRRRDGDSTVAGCTADPHRLSGRARQHAALPPLRPIAGWTNRRRT